VFPCAAWSLSQPRRTLQELSLRYGQTFEIVQKLIARKVAGVQPIQTRPPRRSRCNETVNFQPTKRLLNTVQRHFQQTCKFSWKALVEKTESQEHEGPGLAPERRGS